MRTMTNKHNLSLPLAVLFSTDNYVYDDRENTISATSILKPVQAIVLGMQNKDLSNEVDLMDMVPAVYGTSIHDMAERSWNDPKTLTNALTAMGIPENVQKNIVVNPETVEDNQIPIYVEKQSERTLGDWIITGKFDSCVDGKLSDYKSCSCWKIIMDRDGHREWILQMSIYRWLNPDLVTNDKVSIEVIYTDWSASQAKRDSKYPQTRIESIELPLMSLQATEDWLKSRLAQITSGDTPACTDSDLWATPDKYKYFKKPGAKRATKVYDSAAEAEARATTEGGEVKFFPGEVKRCNWCNVKDICPQAQDLIAAGRLK